MKKTNIEKIVILNIIKNLTTVIFPLITFTYVSRILSPDGLGKVTFARSYISYFTMFSNMGISIYGVRECAKYRSDDKMLRKTIQELLCINIISTVFSFLLLAATVSAVPSVRGRKTEIFIFSIVILAELIKVEWLYAALEDFSYITIRTIAAHSISLILIFLCIRNQDDMLRYIGILVLVEVVIGIVNFIHVRKYICIAKYSNFQIRHHLKPLLYYFFAAVSANLFTNSDTIMLGFLSTDQEIGIYTAGSKICVMAFSMAGAFSTAIMPRMSFLLGAGRHEEYAALLHRTFDYLMMLAIPIALGIMLLADEIVAIIGGTEYSESGNIVRIMSLGIVAYSIVVFIHYEVMGPHNNEKDVMKTTVASAMINVVLNLIFIHYIGAAGAAIATLISKIIFAALCIVKSRKQVSFVKLLNHVSSYIWASASIIAVCLGAKLFLPTALTRLFLAVPVSAAVYFGILLFLKDPYITEIRTKIKGLYHDRNKR